MSLAQLFSKENLPTYSLLPLHPHIMLDIWFEDLFEKKTECFCNYYNLNCFLGNVGLWYNQWKKKVSKTELKEIELSALFKETKLFYQIISRCYTPHFHSPAQRSFSTLLIVKTWLWSTMRENQLVCLCMMSEHKKRVLKLRNKFQK
ncbi:hypothetical protein PR048_022084 [Dryococelus australis]|uniref:Maturase K n=1 Tax=Dryococelus australis TaxID=614101 RepID=A0ABQ9H029_9NEOP|nr:hypothetical protein PR048_022084 [Dryococelus australis]